MQRTMEPYLHRDLRDCPAPGREKGNNHVGRNRQLPPRLEALQREPERALPARRPRIGRYRHHPIGHPADRVGQRSPRKFLTEIWIVVAVTEPVEWHWMGLQSSVSSHNLNVAAVTPSVI